MAPSREPFLHDDMVLLPHQYIAKAVLYFMAAEWVTGEVTDVNGGYFID